MIIKYDNAAQAPDYNVFCFSQHYIVVEDTPSYALGWQFLFHMRVLIFASSPAEFSIDLNLQESTENFCYIIPPMHTHFISPLSKIPFLCIDIHHSMLDTESQEILLLLKSCKQKSLPNLDPQIFTYNNLKPYAAGLLGHMDLLRLFENKFRMYDFGTTKTLCSKNKYYDLCIRFLSTANGQEGKLKYYTVSYNAELIGCSERALHRACYAVLRMSPNMIFQHMILLNCLFQFGRSHRISFHSIAHEIGFADTNAMDKFIKRKLGKTPSQIRQFIHENKTEYHWYS